MKHDYYYPHYRFSRTNGFESSCVYKKRQNLKNQLDHNPVFSCIYINIFLHEGKQLVGQSVKHCKLSIFVCFIKLCFLGIIPSV